tara:strand:- start:65410 stop:65766 length:357 start_codon:yes stop_codon:yes gene_type:complete
MSKPTKCIPVDTAKTLHENWINTRQEAIDRAIGEEDNRSCFYTVAELKEYLDYVTEMSNEQNITNPGIRLYFAAYNQDSNKKATIFLAPTVGDTHNTENNYNIDPFNFGSAGHPPLDY